MRRSLTLALFVAAGLLVLAGTCTPADQQKYEQAVQEACESRRDSDKTIQLDYYVTQNGKNYPVFCGTLVEAQYIVTRFGETDRTQLTMADGKQFLVWGKLAVLPIGSRVGFSLASGLPIIELPAHE